VGFSRWDIVAVHFPYIEGYEGKRRPALIVSSEALHRTHSLYWAAMISSADAGKRPDDIVVTSPEKVGLDVRCAIRLSRLMALSDRQIARRIGAILPKDRAAVAALLRKYAP